MRLERAISTFVLVHGAWHGGWCWDKLVPLLERHGHSVAAPDLPGLGYDATPLEGLSLERWRDAMVDLIEARSEPVILVGHSRGGVVISEIAEKIPDRIETLVYLTAFLLRDGECLMQFAQSDTDSVIGQYFVPSADGISMTVREDGLVPTFYADCSPEDIARAKSLLKPEPMFALVTPVKLSTERFGRVPRVYVECLNDSAITPSCQQQMYANLPCERVISMETAHSPFYAAPEQLAAVLLDVSDRVCKSAVGQF